MKSDYNGLVEQSEINQSVDENFNTGFLDITHVSMSVLIKCMYFVPLKGSDVMYHFKYHLHIMYSVQDA
jgi:hypothetical protein